MLGGVEPTRGTVLYVSREFFDVVGVQPFLGRSIRYDENREGGERVAVLGHGFRQRILGSERNLESVALTIAGVRYTVVGVMPPGFKVLEEGDLYLPRWNKIPSESATHTTTGSSDACARASPGNRPKTRWTVLQPESSEPTPPRHALSASTCVP